MAAIIGIILLVTAASGYARGIVPLTQLMDKSSISLSDLDELNLDIKQGHGPVMFAVVDDKKEIWFWYKPGLLASLGFGKVVLIATVNADDENKGEIIWPASKRGSDYGSTLRAIYGDK